MATELGAAYISILPELKSFGPQIREAFGDVGREADRAGADAGNSFGSGFKGTATKVLSAAAAVGIGATFVNGLNQALSQGQETAKLGARLGMSDEGMARAGKIAGDLYAGNFGGSMTEVNDAIGSVMTNVRSLRDASDEDLTHITGLVLNTADVFGQDLGGITNAVSQMMRTGLAGSAEEALDIITKGFQSGVDKSGDYLDTLNEYGTQFRKMGIDGETATGLISQGIKAGARDSDLVADAIKEFSIRAIDGSEATGAAFQAIGLDAKDMSAKIAKGGDSAKGGLQQVLDGLRAIKDPAKREAAAVGLFGTQAEDMGAALGALDLSTAAGQLGKVGGAAQEASDKMSNTPAAKWESFKRELQTGFVDVMSTKVVPFIQDASEKYLPKLTGAFEAVVPALSAIGSVVSDVTGFFSEHAGVTKTLVGVTAALVAVTAIHAGVLAVSAAGGMVQYLKGTKLISAATKVWAAVQWIMNAALTANPIGLVVVAIAALVAAIVIAWKNSETFRAIVIGAWNAIKAAAVAVFVWIKNLISSVWSGIKAGATTAWDAIKGAISAVWSAIVAVVRTYINTVKAIVTRVFSAVKGVVASVWNAIKGAVERAISGVLGAVSGITSVATTVGNAFQSAYDAVVTKVGEVVTYVTGLPGKITTALGDLGTLLFSAGADIINGLWDGLKSVWDDVTSWFSGITDMIPDIKGPPKRDATLLQPAGKLVMGGFLSGLKGGYTEVEKFLRAVTKKLGPKGADLAKSMLTTLRDGFDGGLKGAQKSIATFTAGIRKLVARRYSGQSKSVIASHTKAVLKGLQDEFAQLKKNAKLREQTQKAQAAALEKYNTMVEFQNSATETNRGELDLGSLGQESEGNDFGFGKGAAPITFASVRNLVGGLASRMKTFAQKLGALAKKGIPTGLIQEVAALGSEKGIAVANALLSGSATDVKNLKIEWYGFQVATSDAAKALTTSMYGIGVDAQGGIVQGLNSKLVNLDKAAVKFASRLAKALKKALDIHSPSRFLRKEIGVPAGQGPAVGIIDGLDMMQDEVDRRFQEIVSPMSLPDIEVGSALAATGSSGNGGFIDYDLLADAMSRRPNVLTMSDRTAAQVVVRGQAERGELE